MKTANKFLVIAENTENGELVPFTVYGMDEDNAREVFAAMRRVSVDLFHFVIHTIFPVVC